MWIAVVGSQTFGTCPCLRTATLATPTHRQVCPALHAFTLMMATLTRWSTRYGIEGVVSGGAPGADELAKRCCGLLGITFLEIKPRSGPEPFRERAMARNTRVVAKVDAVVAFFAPGDPSPGTSDTLMKARLKPIPTFVWHEGSWETTGSMSSASPTAS